MDAVTNDSLKERWQEIVDAGDSLALQIELLRSFLRDYPEFAPAWRILGVALADVSRFEEAEQALRRAIELAKPEWNMTFPYCSMGKMFRQRGDFATAELWYRKAIEAAPDDTQGYIYLGAMLARLGRLAEAEAAHRRATACKAGCIDEAYLNLGLVLRALERYEEALACFEHALQLDPQYKAARLAKRDVQRAMRVRSSTPRA